MNNRSWRSQINGRIKYWLISYIYNYINHASSSEFKSHSTYLWSTWWSCLQLRLRSSEWWDIQWMMHWTGGRGKRLWSTLQRLEENHGKHRSDKRCPGRGSNRTSPEWKENRYGQNKHARYHYLQRILFIYTQLSQFWTLYIVLTFI
jgi:hypothetical protein